MKHLQMDWKKTLWLGIIVVGWFIIGWIARGMAAGPEVMLFDQAQTNLANKAYGQVPARRELTYAAIRGMLAALNDKYAEFEDPVMFKRTKEELRGEGSTRIGIQGEMRQGQFVITSVTPGDPAALAGVQVDDILTEVDGWAIKPGVTASEVYQMVKNSQKPIAELRIVRNGQAMSLEVKRQPVDEVESRLLESGILYIRVDREGTKTPQALKAALESGLKSDPKGLILDLRMNGGGYINATREILDLFLGDGMAFYAATKNGQLIEYPTKSGDLGENIPLIVLTSGKTYSAGETIAAAILERKRGQVMGETTYGKGSVKETVSLADGSAISFTVARWLGPVTQQDYEGRGVAPDLPNASSAANGTDVVLEDAVQELLRLSK